jgi:hypothetical protein
MREGSLQEHYARLATRQRALEEQFHELCGVTIQTFTLVRELLDVRHPGAE